MHVITQEKAEALLQRFDIFPGQLAEWETHFGIDLDADNDGHKIYSPEHIRLFKTIKRQVVMGRSLDEIRQRLILPPVEPKAFASFKPLHEETPIQPVALVRDEPEAAQVSPSVSIISENPVDEPSAFAQAFEAVMPEAWRSDSDSAWDASVTLSSPVHLSPAGSSELTANKPLSELSRQRLKRYTASPISVSNSSLAEQPGPHAGLLILIEKLMAEKDDLQAQLTLLEKQKAHLFKVNELYQHRLHELAQGAEVKAMAQFEAQRAAWIAEKAELQRRILNPVETPRQIETAKPRITEPVEIDYIGLWEETAILEQVELNTIQLQIEAERQRIFRIATSPESRLGQAVVLDTTFAYQQDQAWQRQETLILSPSETSDELTGLLWVNYQREGQPVARVRYRVTCHRQNEN